MGVEIIRACDIFWLVPGVSGGIVVLLGSSAEAKKKTHDTSKGITFMKHSTT
jgi:hypothetical protein